MDDPRAYFDRMTAVHERLAVDDLELALSTSGELALLYDDVVVTAVPDTGDRVADGERLLARWDVADMLVAAGYDISYESEGSGPDYRVTRLVVLVGSSDVVAAESDVGEDGYTATLRRLADEIARAQMLITAWERAVDA